ISVNDIDCQRCSSENTNTTFSLRPDTDVRVVAQDTAINDAAEAVKNARRFMRLPPVRATAAAAHPHAHATPATAPADARAPARGRRGRRGWLSRADLRLGDKVLRTQARRQYTGCISTPRDECFRFPGSCRHARSGTRKTIPAAPRVSRPATPARDYGPASYPRVPAPPTRVRSA